MCTRVLFGLFYKQDSERRHSCVHGERRIRRFLIRNKRGSSQRARRLSECNLRRTENAKASKRERYETCKGRNGLNNMFKNKWKRIFVSAHFGLTNTSMVKPLYTPILAFSSRPSTEDYLNGSLADALKDQPLCSPKKNYNFMRSVCWCLSSHKFWNIAYSHSSIKLRGAFGRWR